MIRMTAVFVLVFALVYVGIRFFINNTQMRRLGVVKEIGYSLMCAAVAVALILTIVILF